MFYPLSVYIGLKYIRAKRRNHFISFISLASLLGIALGVAILITVLAVMNGFDEEIRYRIFGMANHITVSTEQGAMTNWPSLAEKLNHYPGVTATAPFVQGEGILVNQGLTHPTLITGILPAQEQAVSILPEKMLAGRLSDLKPQKFGIILGNELANQLGISVGDQLTLLIPQVSMTPIGAMPRFKEFTVVGIFKIGSGFGFDSDMAFIHLNDAQALFQIGAEVTGLRLKLQDFYAAPKIAQALNSYLSWPYLVTDWTSTYGSYMHAIQLEKTMMFLILLFLIAIAAFNLVSMLVMTVADKRSDIAILRTLGARPSTILTIFMIQGTTLGLIGVSLGLLAGIVLALHVTELVNSLEHIFHIELFASDVYFLNYLPSKLAFADIWHTASCALAMSFLATLYPAWRASRLQPAEALRYE